MLRRNRFRIWSRLPGALLRVAGSALVVGFRVAERSNCNLIDGSGFGTDGTLADLPFIEAVLVLPMIISMALSAEKSSAPTEQSPEPGPGGIMSGKYDIALTIHACRAAEVERRLREQTGKRRDLDDQFATRYPAMFGYSQTSRTGMIFRQSLPLPSGWQGVLLLLDNSV